MGEGAGHINGQDLSIADDGNVDERLGCHGEELRIHSYTPFGKLFFFFGLLEGNGEVVNW